MTEVEVLDKIAISVKNHKLLKQLLKENPRLEEIGEDISDYEDVYGYSIGVTEPRMPVYEYPDYDFTVTDEITNLDLTEVNQEQSPVISDP